MSIEMSLVLQIVPGNINTYLAEKRSLSSAIVARRIRIVPYSARWRTVCMRVELYGCPFYGRRRRSTFTDERSFVSSRRRRFLRHVAEYRQRSDIRR
jgi:hypothetical protein